MKIKNIEKVISLSEDLKLVRKEIENLKKLQSKDTGFTFNEFGDMSASSVGFIYEAGNFPKEVYSSIVAHALDQFINHEKSIIKKIETL